MKLFSEFPHPRFFKPTYQSAFTILIMAFGTIAIWQHNRDILLDLFDYSPVITAAGKVEAGLLPYTGVRSPMQSSVYIFNRATEMVFGRSYLSLTWGGLVQALGGGLLLRWLLRRSLGPVAATMIALAVTMAGLLQHVVFFYNPIGILCLSIVVLGVAQQPSLWAAQSWRTVAIFAALFVGGINKLNFHGTALLLSGLLILVAWAGHKIAWRDFFRSVFLLGLFGLGLPLLFELVWTGATFRQWLNDVVILSSARHAYLSHTFDLGMYLRPVHNYHHHLLVPAIGGCGLLLLAVTGAWSLYDSRRNWCGWGDVLARLALLVAGAVTGALLMITNHESVLLTSLVYPVLAAAIYLTCRRPDQTIDRWVSCLIMGAMFLWSGAGAYATWHGSRVLYGLTPPPRSDYVRLQADGRALAYLKGVRLLPEQIHELEILAAQLQTLEDSDGKLRDVLFGPALEWMERSYPEAIVPHAPIWYHYGTSLKDNDTEYFRELLGQGTRRLVTHASWQAWPGDFIQLLEREYRAERVGSYYLIYYPRDKRVPPTINAVEDSPSNK